MENLLQGVEHELAKLKRKQKLDCYKALLDVDFYPADPELYKAYDRCANLEISIDEFLAIIDDFIAKGKVRKAKLPEEVEYTLSPNEASKLFGK